jgi:hypothetical protein
LEVAVTVTIRLDEDMEAKLRRLLEQKGGSLSAFVRAAIAEKLEREATKPTPYELGKHLFGRYSSGRDVLAENGEKILREMFRAKRRR